MYLHIEASYREGTPDGTLRAYSAEAPRKKIAGHQDAIGIKPDGDVEASETPGTLLSSFKLRTGNARTGFDNSAPLRAAGRGFNGRANRRQVRASVTDSTYEVKSASYASDCIEEALGQILGYVFNDEDPRRKRIVVVGQYPPNTDDQRFIEYVKSMVRIKFSYEHMAI